MRHAGDDLAALVSLAGEQQHVARRQQRQATADGGGAVADFLGLGRGGANGAADRRRILAARVVVGDDDAIGQALGDGAHLRPLAGVAVAAAAEDDDEPAAAMRAQRGKHGLERIGRMRVVDDHRRAVGMRGDMLQTAGHAGERRQRVERLFDRRAGGDGEAEGRERVARLERADEGKDEVTRLTKYPKTQLLARVHRPRGLEPQIRVHRRAEPDDALSALTAERGEAPALGDVDVEHGAGVGWQQLGEEPRLGVEIGVHALVVVEMVARQIGEGRRAELEAVEAELVEAVARRLERDMVDAAPREHLQLAVQRDRVGRGERARMLEIGADDADGTEAHGASAETLPDLAREDRDRGLAVGAGDGDQHLRLRRVEARCHARETASRVGIEDDAHWRRALRQRGDARGVVGEHGDGAARHRVVDEAAAVDAAAGQRREQEAGPNVARIGGQAADVGIARRREGERALSAVHEVS